MYLTNSALLLQIQVVCVSHGADHRCSFWDPVNCRPDMRADHMRQKHLHTTQHACDRPTQEVQLGHADTHAFFMALLWHPSQAVQQTMALSTISLLAMQTRENSKHERCPAVGIFLYNPSFQCPFLHPEKCAHLPTPLSIPKRAVGVPGKKHHSRQTSPQ